jgi:hypothetical protein
MLQRLGVARTIEARERSQSTPPGPAILQPTSGTNLILAPVTTMILSLRLPGLLSCLLNLTERLCLKPLPRPRRMPPHSSARTLIPFPELIESICNWYVNTDSA